jgi:pyridoxal phosphate enzyme (YggS family)
MAIAPREREKALATRQAGASGGRDSAPRELKTLKERYANVRQRIATAAKKVGRAPDSVMLVAVTKYAAIDQVRELIEHGHVDLAESQVQNLVQRAAQIDEFLQRHRQLGGPKAAHIPKQVRWHMIGHLQRNKVRKVLGLARLIHSVDSLRLAEEIQAMSAKLDEPVEVLIQVNISGEKSKYGIAPAAAKHLIDQMDTMINIRVRGLMCMAPLAEDPETVRPVFQRGRELFEDVRRSGAAGDKFDILSMGMSSDFEVAIECGANLVRVGTAIFGESKSAETGPDDHE